MRDPIEDDLERWAATPADMEALDALGRRASAELEEMLRARERPRAARRAAITARQRRWRHRRRDGLTVFRITCDENQIAAALVASGYVTDGQSLDRQRLERVLSELLSTWSSRFSDKA